MKSVVLFSFLFVGLRIATVEGKKPIAPPLQTFEEVKSAPEPTTRDPSVLQLAEWCNRELCKPPDCRCSSSQIPGEYLPSETPQFVTITFDGGVNVRNMETYREVLYGRKNSNGCPAGTTFYVNHEYTNYRFVNELYNQGYEIGLHSISHRVPQGYWANANYNVIKEEIVDQRLQMSHFANIPIESIKGVRLPFLQLSGNTSFQVMANHGLEYDCSWPDNTVQLHVNPLWPYTLDYRSTQGCSIGPCPTASIPKLWVQPMAAWIDRQGFPCAMADSCFLAPWLDDEEGWYEFILTNFKRHYLKNRAPFGIYLRESFLSSNPAVKAAFIRFMDLISDLPDAFMVNTNEVIDWIKDPIPVREYRTKSCKTWREASCRHLNCGPLSSNHNEKRYYLEVCTGWPCPTVYPWTGDPFGHQRPITTARPNNF